MCIPNGINWLKIDTPAWCVDYSVNNNESQQSTLSPSISLLASELNGSLCVLLSIVSMAFLNDTVRKPSFLHYICSSFK